MRKITEIIIHCSATREGQDIKAADIDRWHRQKGWDGCGYHFVIDLDGTIEIGRPIEKVGAHTSGHNANSVGICYVGGLNKDGKATDTRTPQQRQALLSLATTLVWMFPDAHFHGHREFANKACPCFDVSAEFGFVGRGPAKPE